MDELAIGSESGQCGDPIAEYRFELETG